MKTKKTLIVVLLSLMILCLVFSGCQEEPGPGSATTDATTTAPVGPDPDGPDTPSTPVDGTFYCDVDGSEYTLVLSKDGTVTLKFGSAIEQGTYTNDAGKLVIKLADGTAISAVLTEDQVTLTYKKVEYTLLIKKNYTVTFNAGAGEAIEPATVVNGRRAPRPENPTVEGYLFAGWYSDEACTTPYFFNEGVTSDLTLYARYVRLQEGGVEYNVSFNLGYENAPALDAVKTQGGIAYDLPVPEREGYTFLGWWISNEGSADKLSYPYNENKLTADTVLYAAWSQGAVAVQVTDTTISWTDMGVMKTYKLDILKPDGTTESFNLPTTSHAYDFASMPAGVYKITVTVDGASGSAYFCNKPLAPVTVFSVDGSVLTFEGVANAEYYLLYINCGNASHDHSEPVRLEKNDSFYNFDFAGCDMQEGGIRFVVKACADGYMTSESKMYIFEQSLGDVTDVKHNTEDGTVTWAPVENATSYTVILSNDNILVGTYTLTETSLSVKYLTGSVEITVVANAKMYNSSATAEFSYTTTRLPAVQNLKVDVYTVSWNAVPGAVKYVISIGGKTLETTETSIVLTDSAFTAGVYEYDLTVTAVAATEADNSLASDMLKLAVGNMYGELAYNANTLTWNSVIGAVGYIVNVNGVEFKVTEPSATVTLTREGQNVITVCCYTDAEGNNKSNALTMDVTAYKVTAYANGGYSSLDSGLVEQNYFLAVGDKMPAGTVVFPGYTFHSWNSKSDGTGASFEETFALTSAANTAVYAAWTPNGYQVTIKVDSAEGTLDGAPLNENFYTHTTTVQYNGAYKLPVPTSNDDLLAFAGWYSEENGHGIQYTNHAGESVRGWNDRNDDVTLYPYWAEIVSFIVRADGTLSANKGIGVNFVSTVTIPATAFVDGQTRPITAVDDFSSCSNLLEINIPASVDIITIIISESGSNTGSAFASCSKLEAVNIYPVEGVIPTYFSENGMLYRYADEEQTTAELKFVPPGLKGEVVLSDKLLVISEYVFKSTKITSLTIPASVVEIKKGAFYLADLVNINFQEPAEGETAKPLSIANEAFRACYDLVEINLPARLTNLGWNYIASPQTYSAFYSCSKLEKINVAEGCKNYASIDGILVNAEKNTMLYFPSAKIAAAEEEGQVVEFVIPQGITTISSRSFYSNTKITSLVIPGWVTTIEDEAFRGCSGITNLVFQGDEHDADLTIGKQAFYSLTKLTNVTLPANLQTMGQGAFGACSKLLTVTLNSYVSPEEHAEYEQKRLNGTLTPEDEFYNFAPGAFATVLTTSANTVGSFYVTTLNIGAYVDAFDIGIVFGNKITTINTDPNNQYIFSDSKGVIYNAAQTELIYYPATVEGPYTTLPSLQVIGAGVFNSKANLTGITIGKNVTTIGESAFASCKNLEYIIFEEGGTAPLTIGEKAFYACSNAKLTTITLPERTTVIENLAFQTCSYLTNIYLPASLEHLGASEIVPDVNIPNGDGTYTKGDVLRTPECTFTGTATTLVNTMGVFDNCHRLQNIHIAEGNLNYVSIGGVLYGSKFIEERKVEQSDGTVGYEYFLMPADGTARILYLFPAANNGGGTHEYTLPSTLTQIWARSFYYLGNYNEDDTILALKSSVINNGTANNLVKVGSQVFYYAQQIQEIQLPEGCDAITMNMFYYVQGLVSITVPSTVTRLENKAFNYANKLETVIFAEGGTEPLVVEDGAMTYDTYGNASSPGAFSGCAALKTVVLPDRITRVADCMFANCKALEKVVIPASVQEIGYHAFYYCEALVDCIIPENSVLTAIYGNAFYRAPIPNFKIPDTVSLIGYDAFAYSGIKCGDLPAAFDETIRVTSSRPTTSTITSYANGTYAFYQCTELESATIPATIKALTDNIYSYCSNLTTVVFAEGSQLESIGSRSFANCKKLESISIPATVKTIGTYAFTDCTALKGVQLPAGLELLGTFAYGSGETVNAPSNVFQNCTSLTSIEIPASVQSVGNNTFSGCTALTEVTFLGTPEERQLIYIGSSAFSKTALTEFTFPINKDENGVVQEITAGGTMFSGCIELLTVTISDSIWDLEKVFSGCSSVENFILSPTHEKMAKDPTLPLLVSTDGKTVVMVLGELPASQSTVVIPHGYEIIGASAFVGQENLKKIVLPSTVKEIGDYAFSLCLNLEDVVFLTEEDFSLALTTIGLRAFQYTGIKTLNIDGPTQIKTLGQYAFYNCHSLTDVTLKGVKELGNYCFQYCESLTNLDLGQSMVKLGGNTFSFCTSLKEVHFPDSVTTYGGTMFDGCLSLETVTLSNNPSAKSFSSSVFRDCVSLKKIEFPDVVTTYGGTMFDGCVNLTEVKLSSKAATLTSSMFKGCTSLKSFDIPSNVTTYGTSMFQDCTALESVTLSGNAKATKIPNSMFENCTALKSIEIPDVVQYIGKYSFKNTGLEKIDLNKVKILGSSSTTCTASATTYEGAFAECLNLKVVDLGTKLTKSGQKAFQGCVALEKVTFPDTTTQYGYYMFDGCTSLKEVKLSNNASATTIQNYMFQGCTSLTGIVLPDSIKYISLYSFAGSGLESIDLNKAVSLGGTSASPSATVKGYVFKDCVNLKSVNAPELVKYGGYIFSGCTALESYTFSDKTTQYGTFMFENCTALKDVILTKTATTIQDSMFTGCTALTSLVLPEGVKQINELAFNGTGLATLELPKTLATMEKAALSNPNFKSFTVVSGNEHYKALPNGALYDMDEGTLAAWPALTSTGLTMDEILKAVTLEEIGALGAFYGVNITGTVDLSKSGLTEIPSYLFYGMTGDATLILPETLETIGTYAFSHCSAFKNIVLPDSVKTIGNRAFEYVTADTVTVGANVELYDGYAFSYSNIGTVNLANPASDNFEFKTYIFAYANIGKISIPERICAQAGETSSLGTSMFRNSVLGEVTFEAPLNGEKMTSSTYAPFYGTTVGKLEMKGEWTEIFMYMFYQSEIERIEIPASVVEIANYAFNQCSASEIIFLKDAEGNSALTKIGNSAFNKMLNLKSIELPDSVTTIGTNVFTGCAALETVVMGGTIADGILPAYTFQDCVSLTSVKLPAGITEVKNYVFDGCTKLVDIKLPETIQIIGSYVFRDCASLKEMVLPEGLDIVQTQLFQGCTSLEKVVIPSTATKINGSAFKDCVSLKELVIPESIIAISAGTFENLTSATTVRFEASLVTVATLTNDWNRKCTAKFTFNYTAPEAPASEEN